ncbi:MAG: VOC family protein [Nitrososphaerota archaeon]|jgi:lactoylglutathione lyase|nr:VOC family protein [Nitrososphaerota archaeon]
MRLLHTSITVKDMDESIAFYTKHFGMELLSRREIPQNKAEIAFIGLKDTDHRIELTWWKGKKDYAEGDQLDHIAFGTVDVKAEVERLRKAGVEIAKEPYSLGPGSSEIAFVKDPNGIWLELIQRR